MFSVKLKNVNVDKTVEALESCQAQSLIHWILKEPRKDDTCENK